MHVIVGLGNPGSEYENTRHNLGFRVVDATAKVLGIRLKLGEGNYLIGRASRTHADIILVKPLTYMNNSGWAVREVVEKFDLTISELLIVTDDFQIPLGKIRLRMKGSDGGHNGLYSIIRQLDSSEFPRLRCGIGREIGEHQNECMPDFVLSTFYESEKVCVQEMIIRARDTAITAVTEGYQPALRLLSRHNL